MPKVRRFFYVHSRKCTTLHIQLGKTHSEGKTVCGRIVSAYKWGWAARRLTKMPVCKQCEAGL